MCLRALDHVHKRLQVVPVILKRLGDRLAHSLETSEMNNSVNLVRSEQELGRDSIAEIHLDERNILPSGDLLHTLETCHVAIGHIVGDNHIVPSLNKLNSHVTANESGSTGHQNALIHIQLFRFFATLRMTVVSRILRMRESKVSYFC